MLSLAILLSLHGWFGLWADFAYLGLLTLLIPSDLSNGLGFDLLGIVAIGISWIAQNRVLQTCTIFFLTRVVVFSVTDDFPSFWLDTLLQAIPLFTFGFFLRYQRQHTHELQMQVETAKKEAEVLGARVRRELATQLHDTTAKDLARIAVVAQRLSDQPSTASPEELSQLARLAVTASKRIRPMILNLDSHRETISLESSIREAQKMLTARGITLTAAVPDNIDSALTRQQKLVSALIVRECATNILKYAPEDSTASLEMSLDTSATLTITMHNTIAPTPDSSITGGFGLRNLEDRLYEEGGELLFGRRGEDWTLSAEIPVQKGTHNGQ